MGRQKNTEEEIKGESDESESDESDSSESESNSNIVMKVKMIRTKNLGWVTIF